MKKPQEQMKDQLEWLKATAHTTPCLLDIGIGDAGHSVGAFFLRAGQHELSPTEIMHRSQFYWAANLRGLKGKAERPLNIYIKASSQAQSWLMIDDLTIDQCRIIAGDRTHAIVQTSPGLHHLWLTTTRPVSVAERKHCQLVLINRFGFGDKGSADGEHFGRLAGFKNIKRNCWVNFIHAHISDRRADVDKLLAMPLLFPVPEGVCDFTPPEACASSLSGVAPQAQSPSRSFSPCASLPGRDESSAEFCWARGWLSKKLNIDEGIRRLTERAFARGKSNNLPACEKYARRTFTNAAR